MLLFNGKYYKINLNIKNKIYILTNGDLGKGNIMDSTERREGLGEIVLETG